MANVKCPRGFLLPDECCFVALNTTSSWRYCYVIQCARLVWSLARKVAPQGAFTRFIFFSFINSLQRRLRSLLQWHNWRLIHVVRWVRWQTQYNVSRQCRSQVVLLDSTLSPIRKRSYCMIQKRQHDIEPKQKNWSSRVLRPLAGYGLFDRIGNQQIKRRELQCVLTITHVISEYRRKWRQHVQGKGRNRLNKIALRHLVKRVSTNE